MKNLGALVLIVAGLMLHVPQAQSSQPSVFSDPHSPWVPQWAKQAIWYQIFPERFRNGDPGNDPKVLDQEGSWPHDSVSPWEVHPWVSDWYEMQPYETKNGKDI